MPSIPIPIREAKEPVDSGRPYLKPSKKAREKKRRKGKAKKRESRKARKSQCQKKVRQEKSGKNSPRDMVPGHMGTQNHQNTSQNTFQVKRGTFS